MVLTILFHFTIRTGAESGHVEAELDCCNNDVVELEKSNVLLIGPTGSGMMCSILVLTKVLSGLSFVWCGRSLDVSLVAGTDISINTWCTILIYASLLD